MKLNKWIYRISTGLLSLAFLMSSYLYLSGNPELLRNFELIGLPVYLVNILGVAKLLGALALINLWSSTLREWAYAGYVIVLIGAIWTHIATGTSFFAPAFFLVLVGISYTFYKHQKTSKLIV